MSTTTGDPAGGRTSVLGHPRGLVILFFTEMWERFSYYGMRALLIFYLTKYFLFSDQIANGIYAAYISLVYITPVLGGYVADRFLGFRRAIILGGTLILFGHIGMTFEGADAFVNDGGEVVRDGFALQVLFLSLALIAAGTGLLKANISSIVGTLYAAGDRRRDSGFTIFYMGINLGAFTAPLLCGWLGETYGWSYGFGAAAVGMALGLITFFAGKSMLEGQGEPPEPEKLKQKVFGPLSRQGIVVLGSVAMVLPLWFLVQRVTLVGSVLVATLVVTLGVVIYSAVRMGPENRDRAFVIVVLMFFHAVFWALFEQTGTSIALFADRAVDLTLLGLNVAPAQIQSINPVAIFIFAPVFAFLWSWLGGRRLEPSLPVKFFFGLFGVGLGFGVFALGVASAAEGEKVAFFWLILGFLCHTWGELCLSPVGLSAVTKLSVQHVLGLMMGAWFLSNALANYMVAPIANMAAIDRIPGEAIDLATAKSVYGDAFFNMALMPWAVSLLILVLAPVLKKWMHGVR